MAEALSVDLRRRVVDAALDGASCRAAAARFGVSSAIRRVKRFRERGDLTLGQIRSIRSRSRRS